MTLKSGGRHNTQYWSDLLDWVGNISVSHKKRPKFPNGCVWVLLLWWLVFSSGCESHQVVSICLADNCRGEHGSPGSPGSPGSQGSQGAAPTANTFQYSRASFHTTHIKPKLYKSEKKWPLPWSLTMREVTIIILFVTIVVRGSWGRSWQLNPSSLISTCC